MKKIILLLCLCTIGTGITAAQNIELFRFTNANSVSGNDMVLYHNSTDNSVNLIEKSSSSLNEKDGYLQSFILKRLERGKVLIASAKQKKYFLYYDNNSNKVNFSAIENPDALNNYTWQIQFAGKDKVLISPLNNLGKGLVQKSDDKIEVEIFKNSENQVLTGGGKVGNQYRFTIEKIANVL